MHFVRDLDANTIASLIHLNRNTVNRFGQEIAPLILTGPPSVTGFAGGRPKPKDVIAYWPALIRKTMVTPKVKILELK